MSDQVTQQVLVEFMGAMNASFQKAFKEVISGIKGVGAAQKQTNAEMDKATKQANAHAQAQGKFATETEKATTVKSRYAKVMKELSTVYKDSGDGLRSVHTAMRYHAAGVIKSGMAVDVAKKKTTEYLSSLMGMNSVLVNADKRWGDWAKTVKYKTLVDAEANGHILMTRNGIQLLTADAGKLIGLNKDQVKAVQESSLAQDMYSKKLREAKQIGGDYLKSFENLGRLRGQDNKSVATWSRALEQSDVALKNLRKTAKDSGDSIGKVALGVSRASVATNMLQGNLKVSGNSFKVFNEQGLRALGVTTEQASKMNMLAKTYGAYGSTLQKMVSTQDANLKSFVSLTNTYGKSEGVVKNVNSALKETDKIIGSQIVQKQNQLNAAVASGTMTHKQASAELATFTSTLDRTSIASDIFNKKQADLAYGARGFAQEASKAASFGKEYQAALAGMRQAYTPGSSEYKDRVIALTDVEKAIKTQAAAMQKAGVDGKAWAATQDRVALANERYHGRLEITNKVMTNQAHLIPDMANKTTSLSSAMEKLGNSMMNVAKYAVGAFAFYGAISVLSSLTSEIINYDQALKDLQAITTATDNEVALFGETIKDVARATKFSASEVAEGMKNLGQAGFSASETMVVIADAATLATGTLSDMTTVVDLMTTTIRAYHLEASESGRLTDLFANAINRSKLTVDKLRVGMNYLASVADKANISIDDSVTLMGMLANSGVRASTIGTSLRQVIEGLVSPNKAFSEAIKMAGYTVDQFVVSELNPLEDVIRRLQQVVPDAASAFELFGIRGAPAVSAITSNGVEGFTKMKNSMQEAGSATKMAEIQMEGMANKMKNAKDRAGLLAIALGEAGLSSILETLIDGFRGFATLLEDVVNSSVGRVILTILSLGSAVAILNVAVRAFVGMAWVQSLVAAGVAAGGSVLGITSLTAAVGLLRIALMSLVTTPLGIIALGITAVTTVASVITSVKKAQKEERDYLGIAAKKNAIIDREISLNDKKKNAAKGLVSVLNDSTKTESQRALALERLISLGVNVEGVIRDEAGAITNLDEVIKSANPALEAYVAEMDKLSEVKRAEKMVENIEAFRKAEESLTLALDNKRKSEASATQVMADVSMPGYDTSGFDDFMDHNEERLKEAEAQVESTLQKVEEDITAWTTLDAKRYQSMLQSAGMSQDAAAEAAKNFDALDSNFFKLWANQLKNLGLFTKEVEDDFDKIVELIDKAAQAVKDSPEGQFKKLQQDTQKEMKAIMDTMPDLKAPGIVKDKNFYSKSLEKYTNQLELATGVQDKFVDSSKVLALTDETHAEVLEQKKKALEEVSNKMEEDRKDAVSGYIAMETLETEAQKIGLDNRMAALEAANTMRIGDEYDTSNAILDIRKQQIGAEIALKQNSLALLQRYTAGDIEAIEKTRNEIAALNVEFISINAEKMANMEEKKDAERQRAEERRLFDHNMRLAEIDAEYFEDKEKGAVAASEATIRFLDKEIEITRAHIAEKKAMNQKAYEEESEILDLLLAKKKAVNDLQTAKKAEKDKAIEEEIKKLEWLQKALEAGAKNAETNGNITGYYNQSIAALNIQIQALELQRSLAKSVEEEMYYTQQIANIRLEMQGLMAERDMDIGYLMEAGLKKFNVDQYKDLINFYKNLLPRALDATGQAFGDMVVDMAHGEEGWSGMWDKARQTLSSAVDGILADMAKLWAQRFILSMFGGFTGMFGGGTMIGGGGGGSFLHGTMPFFADGGEIGGYSSHDRADNVPIMATAGEFMQPVASVDYYGKGVMEGLRTRSIPRDVLASYAKSSSKSGGSRFAEGGGVEPVAAGGEKGDAAQNLHIVNVLDPGMFEHYMASNAGQKTLMNVLSRNPQVIKNIARS